MHPRGTWSARGVHRLPPPPVLPRSPARIPFPLIAVIAPLVGAIVKRDGVVEETGLGAGVLDDPVTGILWLVHRLAAYGQGIEAGQVVLSGSFIRPIEAPPGSVLDADFGPFGRVQISFA